MTSPDLYEHIWKMVKDIRFGMVTTLDEDGSLTARPMTTVQKEFSGTLWFFTSKSAPGTEAIRSHPTVGVHYSEPKDDSYVSLSGDATIEHDRGRMEALWVPQVKAYFPGGLDDPDLVLMRIDVHKAEYWDVTESKPVQLFKMAKAAMSGEKAKLGEHKTVAL